MSPARIALTLATLVVLGVGAFALRASFARENGPRSRGMASAEPASSGSSREEAFARRLATLEARVARLELERMERRLPALAAASADEEKPQVIDTPVFEAAVRDVVDRVEGEQEEQRRERRKQRMAAWSKDSVDELTERLTLDVSQQEKIQRLFSDHFARMVELREAAPAADEGSTRGQFREAREALDRQLDALLTPEQQQQAEALRESGEFPTSWGRRRRGR